MISDIRLDLINQLCDKNKVTEDYSKCDGKLRDICRGQGRCLFNGLNDRQLDYIGSSCRDNIFLKACPGSGKTEVLGIKSSYEIKKWKEKHKGMAILTFTNSAENEIRTRINNFLREPVPYPHFVGTFTSWIHGYIASPFMSLLKNHNIHEEIKNIKIVESDRDSGFLNSYTTRYSYGKLGKIKANQYYYLIQKGKFVMADRNNKKNKQRELDTVYKKKVYVDGDLKDLKKKFWRDGFYTYEDIEILIVCLFRDYPHIAKLIVNRFPLIVVDECQDLNMHQIHIIELLKRAGCNIHLIGDLDQSIYEFRYVDPIRILKYIERSAYKVESLDINYRSCQSIVNICKRVINRHDKIEGREKDIIGDSLMVLLYSQNGEAKVVNKYEKVIQENKLDINNCSVIVRNNYQKNKILGYGHKNYNLLETYARVVELLNNYSNIDDYHEGILYLAKAIQITFFNGDAHRNKAYFYCPEAVEFIDWRVSLGKICKSFLQNKKFKNWNMTWKEFRAQLIEDIRYLKNHVEILKDRNIATRKIRIGNGLSNVLVRDTFFRDLSDYSSPLEISTIHASKGLTKDSVLVFSSYKANSGFHWKDWFDHDDINEINRLAYVAFSRAKYLLAVAIPKPKSFTREDEDLLESFGFSVIDCF